jgi:hypothetical protein
VLYERALADGAHRDVTAQHERLLRPLALLALATARLPGLALLMDALVLCASCDEGAPVRAEARRLAGEVVRFTVRALDVHARDATYAPDEWIAVGVTHADMLAAEGGEELVDHLEDATRRIAAAIIATENDLMPVPEHLSTALGAGLALYVTIIGEA